jgi:hypothetical protein
MIVRSCKLLVPLGRSSFFNIMNRFSFFSFGCKLIFYCWFETCDVSWWLTTSTCDFLLTFCFVSICCWFVTSYCYSAFVFETPIGCASSIWFIYSSYVGTFSTRGCWAVSSNCLLTPFISTLDNFSLNLSVTKVVLQYFVIQQVLLSS